MRCRAPVRGTVRGVRRSGLACDVDRRRVQRPVSGWARRAARGAGPRTPVAAGPRSAVAGASRACTAGMPRAGPQYARSTSAAMAAPGMASGSRARGPGGAWTSSGPNIFVSNSPRPWPSPCSPDSDPPCATTRSAARSTNARMRATPPPRPAQRGSADFGHPPRAAGCSACSSPSRRRRCSTRRGRLVPPPRDSNGAPSFPAHRHGLLRHLRRARDDHGVGDLPVVGAIRRVRGQG